MHQNCWRWPRCGRKPTRLLYVILHADQSNDWPIAIRESRMRPTSYSQHKRSHCIILSLELWVCVQPSGTDKLDKISKPRMSWMMKEQFGAGSAWGYPCSLQFDWMKVSDHGMIPCKVADRLGCEPACRPASTVKRAPKWSKQTSFEFVSCWWYFPNLIHSGSGPLPDLQVTFSV